MDPAVLVDDDDKAYVYFGGLWGGQLEKWQTGDVRSGCRRSSWKRTCIRTDIVAELNDDMLTFKSNLKKYQSWMKMDSQY